MGLEICAYHSGTIIAQNLLTGAQYTAIDNKGFATTSLFGPVRDINGNIVTAWVDDSAANPDIFSVALAGLPAPAPDFALVFNPTEILVSRASTATIGVFISRLGGFAGNVTVTIPDLSALKIKLKRVDIVNCDAAFGNIQLFM